MTRPRRLSFERVLLALALASVLSAYFVFDLGRFLSLDLLKAERLAIVAWRDLHPIEASVLFFAVYVVVTGLSLPGATILSLAVGAVFGLAWGVVLVSFASSIGATLSFLSARFLLRDWVHRRLHGRLQAIDEGMKTDGVFYLVAMRLVPVLPFFLVNLAMGLTPIRTRTYYAATQLGMLPANLLFINAGTQLAQIDTPADIVSPELLASFLALAALPLVARRAVASLRRRQGCTED